MRLCAHDVAIRVQPDWIGRSLNPPSPFLLCPLSAPCPLYLVLQWIAMEFVDGGSILDKIKKQSKPLNEEQIAYVVHEVLLGLDYLSRSNKIHRDIKAANSKRRNRACTQTGGVGRGGAGRDGCCACGDSQRCVCVIVVRCFAAFLSPAVALRTGEAGE